MIELEINGKAIDGVRLGENAINTLEEPFEMKDCVRCSSRLEHGDRVIYIDKVKARAVTLNFVVYGDTKAEFETNKKNFLNEIYKGNVDITYNEKTYHLIYTGKSRTYNKSLENICSFSMAFEEPNPKNRG